MIEKIITELKNSLTDDQFLEFYEKIKQQVELIFNFVENSWWNKKNHQYDNLKNNFV